MRKITRRTLLKSSVVSFAASQVSPLASGLTQATHPRKGRIRQSVSRWCYQKIPLDQLAAYAAKIGLRGVDLLQPEEYEAPHR